MQVLKRRWLFSLSVLFALAFIFMGVGGSIFGDLDGVGQRVFWAIFGIAVATAILVGLWQCRPRPKLGGTLIVVGAIAGGVLTFWSIVTPVLGLVVAGYGVLRAREMAIENRYEHVLRRGRGSRA